MLIGATMNENDLPAFKAMLAGNDIMRVFPRDVTVAGKTVKVLPAWTDPRFEYCRQVGAIPFVSTKVDGDRDGLAYVREQLLNLPDWITTLYITDRHEPEGDLPADQFKTNFLAFYAMVDGLPEGIRTRIRCGPVLTRTWTERDGPAAGLKPGRTYRMYDPGIGDFLGVDMYVQSGTAKAPVTAATLPRPEAFCAAFKAYRFDDQDHRDRIWPETGLVGFPADVDGTVRAAWIRGVHAEVAGWDPAETGWKMIGWIWWNSLGKATGQVAEIGQRRDFPLHLRTQPAAQHRTESGGVAPQPPTAVQLPGDPPPPVAAFNDIWRAQHTPTAPVDAPAPDADPYQAAYTAGWRDGREHLLTEMIALVRRPVEAGSALP